MSTDSTLTPAHLRESIAIIDEHLSEAQARLVAVQAEARAATEANIASLSRNPFNSDVIDTNRETVTAAAQRVEELRATRAAAEKMLARALDAERLERDEQARAKLCPLIAEVTDAGSKIDEAAAILAQNINVISNARYRAQTIINSEMQREIYGGAVLYSGASEIASAVSRHIASLMSGNPTDLDPFGARGAERLAKQIKSAARIPDTESGED